MLKKFGTLNIIMICVIQLGLSITQGVCVKSMYSFDVKKTNFQHVHHIPQFNS